MADTKITALTAITTVDPAADVLPIVDVSDTSMAASGTTKKITSNQILGAGGTATLASATISGDLTVDTSTLKVDSSNNRVGIRTASPAEPLTVDNTSGITTGAIRIYATDQSHSRLAIQNINGQAYHLVAGNPGTSNAGFALYDNTAGSTRWYVDNTGVHTFQNVGGVAGTAMTLNSSGLGIGASPTQKLHVKGIVNFEQISGGTNGWQLYTYTDGSYRMNYNGAGSDELIIDTTGNVGIGVTPSAWGANYKAFQIGAQSCLYNALGYITSLNTNAYENSSGQIVRIANGEGTRYVQAGGSHQWFYASNASAGTVGGFTQAMTLDASGNLLVGQTTAGLDAQGGFYFRNAAASGGSSMIVNHRSAVTGGNSYAEFTYNGVGIGSITQSGTTGVAFNATSDYRLKEAVQPITGALNRIAALKPSIYKWKTDGSNGEGFLAHELAEAVPLAVTGEKDAVNEDGSIKPQQVDLSKVVPVLVAAIQELAARVQTLETR